MSARAEIVDIFVEAIAIEDRGRDGFDDRIRTGSNSGRVWIATIDEVETFIDQLRDVVREARKDAPKGETR